MDTKQLEKKSLYRVTIIGEGVNIDQKISREVTKRLIGLVFDAEKIDQAGFGQIVTTVERSEAEKTLDPKTFMSSKKPGSDMERIACLAYYLTHFRNVPQYKTVDLTALNIEAAQPRFSNAAVAAKNAVKNNYLSVAGNGKRQITTRGEAVVRALPDRSAVKKAWEEYPLHKRKSKRNSKRVGKEKNGNEE
jgi:hypothetical protein